MADTIPEDVTGRSLLEMVAGLTSTHDPELYVTEATWMRKHGWRTPDWKLIVALEPDFHFKPEVELYDLRADPGEEVNLVSSRPDVVADLRGRMDVHIAERTKATGRPDPIEMVLDWHGKAGQGAFASSQEAYDTLHIGDPEAGRRLQAGGSVQAGAKRAPKVAKAGNRPTSKTASKSTAKQTGEPVVKSATKSSGVTAGAGAAKKARAAPGRAGSRTRPRG
jgi:hypothetical protein